MTMTQSRVLGFDQADRMRKALRESKLGVEAVAAALEVDRGTVGRWINGGNRPRQRDLKGFAELTGVDPEWLQHGVEPIVRDAIEGLRGTELVFDAIAAVEAATGMSIADLAELCARRDLNPRPIGLEPAAPSERSYWALCA